MSRYASITIWLALFFLMVLSPCLVSAANITQTKASIGENCTASGVNSTAMGLSTIASDLGSTAMGVGTTASGVYSTAMGVGTTASGIYAIAMGLGNNASGPGSTAMGVSTTASGVYSTAMGVGTTASGINSTAMGEGTIASGVNSTAMGASSTAAGDYSWAGGANMQLTDAADQTFVWGYSDNAESISTANAFLIFPAGTAGKVGIGTTSPGYLLEVNGSAAKPGGGSWSSSSDQRLKDVAGAYEGGLDQILGLKPVTFYYKDGNPRDLPTDEEYVGFIAQEVQKVFPEAVSEGSDGYLDFNMHPVNVAVVNAIKELKIENDKLKAENEIFKEKIRKIEALLGI